MRQIWVISMNDFPIEVCLGGERAAETRRQWLQEVWDKRVAEQQRNNPRVIYTPFFVHKSLCPCSPGRTKP